jgi:hypothetical protein
VGFHRDPPTNEIVTPNIDALVGEGVELTRHYVYMSCTPSRSSVQSGAWVPDDSGLFDFIYLWLFQQAAFPSMSSRPSPTPTNPMPASHAT